MTANQFRKLALSLEGAEERSHMGHPDFRANGRIFATLAYPDDTWGMVKLTPEQQRIYIASTPDALKPASGKWGLDGCTMVNLPRANADTIADAMKDAWLATKVKSKAKAKKPATARKRIAKT